MTDQQAAQQPDPAHGFTPDELEIARLREITEAQAATIGYLRQHALELRIECEALRRKVG